MATPTPASGPKEEAWIRPFWINKQDIEHQKELYRDLQHSVTLIKYELGGLALGLTLVKADFSILKADEKGITFRGRQVVTFPWADKKKSLEERIRQVNKKISEDQEFINKKITRLENMKANAEEGRGAAREARDQAGTGGRADAAKEVMKIRFQIAEDVHRAAAIEKKVDRQVAKIEGRSDKLEKLSGKLKTITDKEKALKEAGEKAKENAEAAKTALSRLNAKLKTTQGEVINVSRALSG
ncbi:hypothetical protein GCM10009730_31800 [Streptomyces albidochromogenes]